MTTPSNISVQQTSINISRGWFIGFGIVVTVLGILAVAFPFATTIAAKSFLGWLFLISGIFQIAHSFSTKEWNGFFLNLLVGVLYVFVGGWLAFFPLAGIVTLTILLALTFILQGILEAGMALRMRPVVGWGWILFSGMIAAIVGILILSKLPSSATWAIGLLVGINMISSGLAYLFLVLSVGKNEQTENQPSH